MEKAEVKYSYFDSEYTHHYTTQEYDINDTEELIKIINNKINEGRAIYPHYDLELIYINHIHISYSCFDHAYTADIYFHNDTDITMSMTIKSKSWRSLLRKIKIKN